MLINKFIDYLHYEKGYSKNTLLAYEKDVISFRDFLTIVDDKIELIEVSYSQIRQWIVALVNEGIANRSINRKISALKSFYKFLEKTGDIETNPLQGHRLLKIKNKTITPFSKNELEKLADFFSDNKTYEDVRDYCLIELLYTTGMRRGELIGLNCTDINVDSKTVKVLGKRNKERYIPLLESTIELLQRYILLRAELKSTDTSLFLTLKGKPLYDSLVYKIVTKYLKLFSTKEKKSPHILRHAFATHLLDEGADLNVVKELLGHASLASTQVYTKVSLSHLKEAYRKAHPRNKDKGDN